jgi:hypothetical protein
MRPRYAVYFSPATTSPWWDFGAGWLGRDECNNLPLAQAGVPEISSESFHALTEEPRRYGFHATLKAPFHLQENVTSEELVVRLNMLATQLAPVKLGPLCAVKMAHFVALVPQTMGEELSSLAQACVTELDDLRAPMTELEVLRRQVDLADARGQYLLRKYGYPHVLERFVLHFTLSGRVTPLVADQLITAVKNSIDPLNRHTAQVLDRLCLFVEDAPGEPFRRIADLELTG